MSRRARRIVVWGGAAGGLLLAAIGVRFLVVPVAAQRFFGITREVAGFDLHYVIGLRDIWLGVIAVAAAWLGDMRVLAIWFLLASGVCFADMAIVAGAGGPRQALGFHLACGVLSLGLAALAWREMQHERKAGAT